LITKGFQTSIPWHKDKGIPPAMAAFVGLVTEKLEEAEDAALPGLLEGSYRGLKRSRLPPKSVLRFLATVSRDYAS
jgi:hypothetical protein